MSDMSTSRNDTHIATRNVASLPWTPRDVAERLASQMSEYRLQLGRRVVKYREAKSWNQEDLAYHSGLSVRTIQRVERGQHDGRLKTIEKLAEALEVTQAELRGPVPESDDLRPLVEMLSDQVQKLTAQVDRLTRASDEHDAGTG